MKKVLALGVVLVGISAMTSCKKSYTCTIDTFGVSSTVEYNDLKKKAAKAAKTACTLAGGTWAVK